MIVQHILAAAVLVAAGIDPIDRAHGASRSAATLNATKQAEPGFWTRVTGGVFSRKSTDVPPQSTRRAGSQASSARTSTDPEAGDTTVYSNVTVRQLLANRMSRSKDSRKHQIAGSQAPRPAQADKRPILDRLRARLSWNQQRPAVDRPQGRFAWFKKPKGQATQDSALKTPRLEPVPDSPATDPATPAVALLIRKNYPEHENTPLTQVAPSPHRTDSPAENEKNVGTLTPLVVTNATSKVSPASREDREANADVIAAQPHGASSEPQPQRAGPSVAATAAAPPLETIGPGSNDRTDRDVEQAGPVLGDPNVARSNSQPSQDLPIEEDAAARPVAASTAELIVAAELPGRAAAPAPSKLVEPAKLVVGDQQRSSTVTQTGFVQPATAAGTNGGSNAQHDGITPMLERGPASNTSILSAILSPAICERLFALPIECYPVGGLLLGSMLVLLLSRGRPAASQAAPQLAPVATHLSGAFGWPVSMIVSPAPHAGGADQPAQVRGGLFGALATTIGLAITAVGAMAVLRAQIAQQSGLMRPGVVIAAAGQFVLLLGIIAMAVQGRRSSNGRPSVGLDPASGSARAERPVVAGTLPHFPIGTTYAWPTPPPVGCGQSNQSGQIAQLKAQLACLSQQLDHLDG